MASLPSNNVDAALVTLMETSPELQSIIGDRIYPLHIPQAKGKNSSEYVPCAVYVASQANIHHTLGGPHGTRQTSYSIGMHANKYSKARALLGIMESLFTVRNMIVEPDQICCGPLKICCAIVNNSEIVNFKPDDCSDTWRYIALLDVNIWHEDHL